MTWLKKLVWVHVKSTPIFSLPIEHFYRHIYHHQTKHWTKQFYTEVTVTKVNMPLYLFVSEFRITNVLSVKDFEVYYLTSVCFNILMRVKGEFTNYNEDKMKNKSLTKDFYYWENEYSQYGIMEDVEAYKSIFIIDFTSQ